MLLVWLHCLKRRHDEGDSYASDETLPRTNDVCNKEIHIGFISMSLLAGPV
jgi:hypothetical protein